MRGNSRTRLPPHRARSITTTYGYDTKNRLISKVYSDSAPKACFYYHEGYVTIGSWNSPTLTNTSNRLSHTVTTNSARIHQFSTAHGHGVQLRHAGAHHQSLAV